VDRWVIDVRRRTVITGFAALLVAPEHLAAQQPSGTIPRVGILTPGDNEKTRFIDAFRERLRDLGYVEGRNIILEFRFAGGDRTQGRRLAEELVAVPVDVIVEEAFTADVAAVTERIPIVSVVLSGVALSLASERQTHPGGNITGFTLRQTELNGKRLELLRTAFPQITAISALANPANSAARKSVEQFETTVQSIGLRNVQRVEAESAAALRALSPAVFSGADGVVVLPSGLFYNFDRDVVALINAARLPAIYPERDYADDGGLMAYGANVPDNFRRAADYVDRILKGTKLGDLPIQEPVKFDFVVNLKTAHALGLTIPPSILDRATEVVK
jgi:putative ABC transport system substrate-binding protein